MKKTYLLKFSLILLILLSSVINNLKAQVSGYAFASSAGAYTTLAGGTVLITGAGSADSWVSAAITIPAFTFNCVSYTTAYVTSNGQVTLDGAAPSAFTYTGISSTIGSGIAICPFSADLNARNANATSEIRWQTVGAEVIFQWSKWCRYGIAEDFDMQVRLNNTTGAVKIVYRLNSGPGAGTSYQPEVGIRTSITDYNNLQIGTGAATWAAPNAGGAPGNNCRFTSDAPAKNFTSGQTYTWTPSPACSGTPLAGTATSPGSVCSGVSFSIPLTVYTSGCGISYQWQSASAIGGPYTNIAGATATTYTGTQTSTTYYRCITTCANGGATNTSSIATVAMSTPTACYCTSTATSTSDMDISNISFGTINNTSATVSLTGTQGTATGTAGMYSDWRASTVPVPNVMQGQTVPFSVQIDGSAYSHRVDVYIDFNQDGDLVDAGENFAIFAYADPALPNTTSVSIPIPLTASVGNTLMRIVCIESSTTNPCGTYTWGETEDYKINIIAAAACVGTPASGTATATPNTLCVPATSTLNLSGYTIATGITFQWESGPAAGGPWTSIVGATSISQIVAPSSNTYYHCVVTCTNSGLSASSPAILVTVAGPAYAPVGYTTSFEGNWVSRCGTREIPDNFWVGSPITGDNSWRRDDDGAAAAWGSVASFIYAPTFSLGANSARFHSGNASSGTIGTLDLYINLSTLLGTKQLQFDYINTSGSDKLDVFLSTDGGLTFPTTLNNLTLAAAWTTFTADLPTNSATCVIRFKATSDYGSTDIGLDAISIIPPCTGTPTAGAATVDNASFCNTATPLLTVSGFSASAGLNFQWQSSPTNAPYAWSNIIGGTTAVFSSPSISQTTYFRCVVTCSTSGASDYTLPITVTKTGQSILTTNNPFTIVCSNTAVLTATASGGASIKWYTALVGGTSVATGGSYTTPAISANTTFYCAANSGTSIENGGMPAKNNTYGYLSTGYGIIFNANQAFTLNSVVIYPKKNGNVTIALQDNTGTEIAVTGSIVVNGGNTYNPVIVPLGFAVPMGTGYRLVLKAYSGANLTDMIYDYSTSFPYNSPSNALSVTSGWYGTGTSSTNYYFYNLNISIPCESTPRTPVNVIVSGGVTPPVCSASPSPSNAAGGICPVNTIISWAASNTACRAATGYKLYFGTNAAANNIINGVNIGNVLNYNLGTLIGSTLYYWKIVPTNTAGDAVGCATWTFTTVANPGSICAGLLGAGVTNVATLPYASGAGTTAGFGNDLTTANIVSCGSSSYNSGEDKVWIFTPTASGNITITLSSTGTYTGLTLFDGCPLSAGACGAAPGNCVAYAQGYSGDKTLNFCVLAGVTYYLILDSWSTPLNNTYSNLTISAPTGIAVAANDLPCNAQWVLVGDVTPGDNSCTSGAGEPAAPSCWSSGPLNTVWYKFQAPATGNVKIKTIVGSLLNTQIALYAAPTGCPNAAFGAPIACNDNAASCGSSSYYNSEIIFSGLTPTAWYYISVDGSADATGTFSIVWVEGATTWPPVPGQDCISGVPVCAPTFTIGNPGYQAVGNICDFPGGGTNCLLSGERGSAWYELTVNANGNLMFTIEPNDAIANGAGLLTSYGTDYDFGIWKKTGTGAVACGAILAGAAPLVCNYSGIGVTGCYTGGNNPLNNSYTGHTYTAGAYDAAFEPPFPVVAGEVYWLVISNFSNSTSGFTINFTNSTAGYNFSVPNPLIWTGGAATTNWFDPINWGNCSQIPDATHSAIISSAPAVQPIINAANASCLNITINAGASLTINAGFALDIWGNYNNQGTLNAAT
ncbi:MAG: hypothetical protein HXX09_14830, partial [Bacteroidetes bacterium]|nr:hypothetical protein [Bacteroidota bacterium]